ncbi:hypothetical protein EV667_2076 [Ancylobacter aquaticus]|uniref:DUF6916 domain-containing protein n=1 Tax=Ancylobacter aquaticus TaxID=100 RepID=A0A4R1I400_ANCAQ|nr:hypothetical protein [Ancylobacter aquaticus]TCK28080.1 hypothetical protein EV667_2076 [Ancylobacter aquaticus]
MDIAALTIQHFAPRVGESFAVETGQPGPLRIVLREAAVLSARGRPDGRDGFQLLFEGEGPYCLAQLTHRLHHDALGELEMFLVPIAGDGNRFTYQAIFS